MCDVTVPALCDVTVCLCLQISLLDSKRSLNVNIFLRQFKISHRDIIAHLAGGESEAIGAEKLRGLLKILPEGDEVTREKGRWTERFNKNGIERDLAMVCHINIG